MRATRIAPISAVREGGMVVKQQSRKTLVFGLVVTALSVFGLVYGTLGSDVSTAVRILGIAGGAFGIFIGLAVIAPRLVRPLAHVVGLPAARLGGAAGRLAQENAIRNPGRTASTAAALMIGLDARLVRGRLRQGPARERRERAAQAARHEPRDHLAERLGRGPDRRRRGRREGARRASSARRSAATRSRSSATARRPSAASTRRRSPGRTSSSGSRAARRRSRRSPAAAPIVREGDGHVGDTLVFVTPAGKDVSTTVRGVYKKHGDLDQLLGNIVLSQKTFDANFPRPGDMLTLVQADSTAGLERALAAYPDAKLQTGDEFIANWTAWLNDVMNLFYVLLALSVIVSLFGMVNTLVLAVFERTRELGMLRAVGMTRRQARRMIRQESVITALIGAALGLPLGIGLAALVTQSLSKFGVSFTLPVGTLVVFTVVAILAGVLAAIAPARRAARLNVLNALQYE